MIRTSSPDPPNPSPLCPWRRTCTTQAEEKHARGQIKAPYVIDVPPLRSKQQAGGAGGAAKVKGASGGRVAGENLAAKLPRMYLIILEARSADRPGDAIGRICAMSNHSESCPACHARCPPAAREGGTEEEEEESPPFVPQPLCRRPRSSVSS